VILATWASIFVIGIFTTAVPDFTKSLRLQVKDIGYDTTEATEKYTELLTRFSALTGKDFRQPEDYGKLAKDNLEDPVNDLLDETTDFSDMKLYPIIYIIVLSMIILGIFYLPACFSVFCGLLAILQIVAFVVILVMAVISTDVAGSKYEPIIQKSAEGDANFTKIVNFYFYEGPFLLDFDENLQTKILGNLQADEIVEELIKLKKKKGGKVADVTDDELDQLPQIVKDKLNDYEGNDENVNEMKNRLKKLGRPSDFINSSKNLYRRELAEDLSSPSDSPPGQSAFTNLSTNTNQRELPDTTIPLSSSSDSQSGLLSASAESSSAEIDMTKVTTWYAEWLQTKCFEDLKEDVEKNFPHSYKEFKDMTSATAPEDIAAVMNADPELKNAYVYPYGILKSVRMFQRNYLDEKMKTFTTSIENNLVTPLGNAFICLFCLWLLTALLMITVILRNCSREEEAERKTEDEVAV